MSQETRHASGVIGKYLGTQAALGGPFALLGLKHAPLNDAMILRACRARLVQINEHRWSNTPDSDEVRLAVHTAASQLLDQELRVELAKQWSEGTGDLGAAFNTSPVAWRVEQSSPLDERIKQQAIMLLGACGGWNTRSRKRLGQFARIHKLSAAQLVGAITGEQRNLPIQGVAQEAVIKSRAGHTARLIDPSSGTLPWLLIPVLYMLMGLALVSTGYVKLKMDVAGQIPVIVEEAVRASIPGDQRSTDDAAAMVTDRRHHSAVLFELEQFSRVGVTSVEDAKLFSELGDRFALQWTEFDAQELGRASDAVDAVLGGILSKELFVESVGFLTIHEDGPEPMIKPALRVWLSGNVEFVPEIQQFSTRAQKTQVSGSFGSFQHSLGLAFTQTAMQSEDSHAWWVWWIGQLGPMFDRDQETGESFILTAAYERLVAEPIGTGSMEHWKESAGLIVRKLAWGNDKIGIGTRAWLMGAVVDERVRSDRLAIFTRAMVLYSSAGGLGFDVVSSASDSMAERENYLSLLRESWVVGGGDDTHALLLERIRVLLKLTKGSMSQSQAMIRAVELGRVNSACSARSRDDQAVLSKLISIFDTPYQRADRTSAVLDLSSSVSDERWATDAQNIEGKQALFQHIDGLDRFDSIGPKSAHALVYLATQASDMEVRTRAERAMSRRADDIALLIALDRIAGAKRTTRRMRELILNYLGVKENEEEVASVRSELFGRLAELGVFGSPQGVGGFERELNEVFQMRIDRSGFAGSKGVYNTMVLDRLFSGEDVPVVIQSRLAVRLRVSNGGMQRSLAYQAAAMELFGENTRRDYPVQSSRIDRLLLATSDRMLRADGVVEQMAIVERGLAELWLIVLESEGVS